MIDKIIERVSEWFLPTWHSQLENYISKRNPQNLAELEKVIVDFERKLGDQNV